MSRVLNRETQLFIQSGYEVAGNYCLHLLLTCNDIDILPTQYTFVFCVQPDSRVSKEEKLFAFETLLTSTGRAAGR